MTPTITQALESAQQATTSAFLIFGLTLSQFIIAAAAFVGVLFILVIIHELGHYWAARLIGVHVDEFGFGLPPRLWGKKIGNTIWSLNALPIGGFVRLAGEDEAGEDIEKHRKQLKGKHIKDFFWGRSKLERSTILLAGVTMNFLLAVGITAGLLVHGIEEPLPAVKIEAVLQNSPAEAAGIQPGDRIIGMIIPKENGESMDVPIRIPEELKEYTAKHAGKEITLIYKRGDDERQTSLVPRTNPPENQGAMGIQMDYDTRIMKYPIYLAPFKAIELNITRARDMLVAIGTLPFRALEGQNIQNEVAGPVGIAQVVGVSALMGVIPLLNIISLLSLSLAVLNIMPIPALDGGRLLFIVIEAITGKTVNQELERKAHTAGFILLISFILLVSFNDILRIFTR